jgi:hypothetical protein
MTDSAYRELMQKATSYLRSRNEEARKVWSIGSLPLFDWNQQQGQLIFSGDKGGSIIADIQFIGSWSETAGTWMWAWANDSVLEAMKREVQEVREFGRSNDLEELTDPVWKGPIEAAWDMTSLSCYILQSEMAYRAPDSGKPAYTFLSLRNLRRRSEKVSP